MAALLDRGRFFRDPLLEALKGDARLPSALPLLPNAYLGRKHMYGSPSFSRPCLPAAKGFLLKTVHSLRGQCVCSLWPVS